MSKSSIPFAITLVLCIAAMSLPTAAQAETAVFTFDSFEWLGGQLNPAYCRLPIELGFEVATVDDVRISFSGVSHTGTGVCCLGGDCVDVACSAQLKAYFYVPDAEVAVVDLPGEGVAYDDSFVFMSTDWSYLLDGSAPLHLIDSDATGCGSKCSAYVDLSLVTVEVDYSMAVPNQTTPWGTVKASYR